VSTRACTGASQVGKTPAKCSIKMAMEALERSVDGAVDHARRVLGTVLADVGQPKALGRTKSSWIVAHCHLRLSESVTSRSILGP